MGTSGGVWGLERGFCLMIGGDADVVERLDPMFAALSPGGPSGGAVARRARRREATSIAGRRAPAIS